MFGLVTLGERMGKAEGVLGAVLLSTVIAALVGSHTSGEPDNLLYHYQTFIIGLLTLGSAIFAAFLLHRQTRQTATLERERKAGQREAARAWLSLHLSAIIRYAKGTGESVWNLMQQCQNDIVPNDAQMPPLPSLPMEAAVAVKDFAQFCTNEEAKFLALMFSTMQVMESRVAGLEAKPTGRHHGELENYLEDAAELYARAEGLLSYARHTSQVFPAGVTWARFSAALFFITHFHEPTNDIARRIKDGMNRDPQSFMPNRFEQE